MLRSLSKVGAASVLAIVLASLPGPASAATVDGEYSEIGPLRGGSVLNLTVVGRGGVPATGVGAVVLNVTVTRPMAASFLTVWPTGEPRPNASNLNFVAGQTVPNMVLVPVGAGGQVSIFNESGSTDVLVDVLGWFPTTSSFTGLTPARLIDTRVPSGGTIDGAYEGGGTLVGGEAFNLPVRGRGGVPASGVGSVVLNVTVTRPTTASFITVWPAGTPRPNASNLNFTPGQTVPNMVMVPVGLDGQISVFLESGTADLIVDVQGWFPAGSGFIGLTPARLFDTRAPGGSTLDGLFAGTGPLIGGNVFNLPVRGRGEVPTGWAVALNVTATRPSTASFLTLWAGGGAPGYTSTPGPIPNASNLNFTRGQTVANMAIVPVECCRAGGMVALSLDSGTTDVIVDVLGYFPDISQFTPWNPVRLLDTRITSPTP